jgi:hypothetical protein
MSNIYLIKKQNWQTHFLKTFNTCNNDYKNQLKAELDSITDHADAIPNHLFISIDTSIRDFNISNSLLNILINNRDKLLVPGLFCRFASIRIVGHIFGQNAGMPELGPSLVLSDIYDLSNSAKAASI